MRAGRCKSSPTDLGSTIRQARKRKRLSQRALADAVGFTQSAVCVWEKNRFRPSRQTLAQIAEVLGLDDLTLGTVETTTADDRGE
jgi:transcriptional regulator with XRE-family HTH domain